MPDDAGVTRLCLRTTPDGEAEYREAVLDRRTDGESWWRVDFRLTTHSPPPARATKTVFYQIFPDRFAREGDAGPLARLG